MLPRPGGTPNPLLDDLMPPCSIPPSSPGPQTAASPAGGPDELWNCSVRGALNPGKIRARPRKIDFGVSK